MRKVRLEHYYLRDMNRKMETGKSIPLDSTELDYLAHLLERSSVDPELNLKIWTIVRYSHSHPTLLKIAKNIVLQSSSSDDDVYKNHADIVFHYYLKNPSVEEQQEIIKTLDQCNSLKLRMIIAEFYMAQGDIRSGLHLMMDIFAHTGMDHALHDSVMIWMSQKVTFEIKNEFLKKAKDEREKGNISCAEHYEWICENCIPDIHAV